MAIGSVERVQKLIEAGGALDLDWVLCTMPENIYYFSGFRTMFYTRFIGVLVPVKEAREPVLFVSFIDRRLIEDRIWSPPWLQETIIWGPGADCKYSDPIAALGGYLKPGQRLGVDTVGLDLYRQLGDAFPGLDLVNLQDPILKIRMVKSEEEVQKIGEAFALTESVMARVPEFLKHAETELDLAAELNYAALKAGVEDNFYPTLVSTGSKSMALHSPPLPRPIEPGAVIRVACGWQVDGYGADLVRHYCIGPPPAAFLPFKDAYFEALEVVDGLLRPGTTTPELISAVEACYRRHGCLSNWVYSVGHGLALTIHELPKLVRGDETVLQENMVLAIEPLLICPPYGVMNHCEAARITATGAQWLSDGKKDIIEV